MKKGIIAGVIAIIAIAGITAIFVMNKKDATPSSSEAPNPATTQESTDADTGSDTPETNTVAASEIEIEDFKFGPANITVKKGTTVTWTNKDSAPHNVISDGPGSLESETLNQGDTYQFTFNEVGTFNYICTFHSGMSGTVTVTE